MTVTNPNGYVKDTDPWVHSTFIVSLGDDGTGNPIDYATYVKIVQNNQLDGLYGTATDPALEKNMATVIASAGSKDSMLPAYFSHSKCRDTTLGGNDAINSLYQFNETDDPPHPFTMPEIATSSSGMGRVYSETIDDTQQIMYMTFGLPVFNNLSSFYTDALDKDTADLVNSGASTNILDKLVEMGHATITTLANIPELPEIWLKSLFSSAIDIPITKYYDFSNRMDLYQKYVQTILTHLSVNMGFMNDNNLLQTSPTASGNSKVDTASNELSVNSSPALTNTPGVPDMFNKFHMDIYKILQRRASFMMNVGQDAQSNVPTTDSNVAEATSYIVKLLAPVGAAMYSIFHEKPVQNFATAFVNNIYNATLYIGFRIEKSTDSSESISNQIGPPEIASTINSKQQAARSKKFTAMYGSTGFSWLDSFSKSLGDAANATTNAIDNSKGIDGLTALATGSGMIDIPDVWKDSSISKSYSFNLRLRTPYGDPLSVMQSLYVPLALLLAATLPRSTGNSSYSTPFICRAYCRGMFAIPLGMIENMTIKRGNDVNGWTYQRLPTSLDISFTIKDLSPCMYMGMADLTTPSVASKIKTAVTNPLLAIVKNTLIGVDSWNSAFGNNSNFQEYLLTLSGIGLAERTTSILNIKRKVQMLLQTVLDFRLNPLYWDSQMSSSLPGRLITAIIPITKVPSIIVGNPPPSTITGVPTN